MSTICETGAKVSPGVLRRADGYVLFAALKRADWVGNGEPCLQILGEGNRILFRSTPALASKLAALTGERLSVDGMRLRILETATWQIEPVPVLQSWLVTIKGKQCDQDLRVAVQRQMAILGVSANVTLGPRRVVRVCGVRVVGYGVRLLGLSAKDSVAVQAHGLGGRNRFGCGVFVGGTA